MLELLLDDPLFKVVLWVKQQCQRDTPIIGYGDAFYVSDLMEVGGGADGTKTGVADAELDRRLGGQKRAAPAPGPERADWG